LKNKRDFLELPNVWHVYNVLKRGTYWFKRFNGQQVDPYGLSAEARLILGSCSGLNPLDFLLLPGNQILALKCSRPGLSRFRNWIITLDGLLISIYLGSQGHTELCNWEFFDDVMQTYLKKSIGDLFKRGNVLTYYSELKRCRNLIKDKVLKERTLINDGSGRVFPKSFWYFDKIIKVLGLNVTIITPQMLETIGYLTQTRCCGLPPEPVEVKALEDFQKEVGTKPPLLNENLKYEISRACEQFNRFIKSLGNFEGIIDAACKQTKISLSNSASFFHSRKEGGKVESARILLNEIPDDCPFFDLETGKVLKTFSKDSEWLTPGEKIFHYSLMVTIDSLCSRDPNKPHIGDVRVSVVEEPGKARVITVSRVEHSNVLHPLAHFLSVIIALVDSSKTGLVASDHMWDTFKRIDRESVPIDGIYSAHKAVSTFLGSEDWTDATNSSNPYPNIIVMQSFVLLGVPKWYLSVCKTLFTMPRRVYNRSILQTNDFSHPLFIKYNGVLQGDPCCKQMLHMTHIVSRIVSRNRMKRIGLKISYLPGYREDPSGNLYGAIPNYTLLKQRLSKEDFHNEVRKLLRGKEPKAGAREDKQKESRLDLLSSIGLFRKPTPNSEFSSKG